MTATIPAKTATVSRSFDGAAAMATTNISIKITALDMPRLLFCFRAIRRSMKFGWLIGSICIFSIGAKHGS
jgi:hypothetical protein